MFSKTILTALMLAVLGCANSSAPTPSDDSWLDDWKGKPATEKAVRSSENEPAPQAATSTPSIDPQSEDARRQNAALRNRADQLSAENKKLAARIAEAKEKGWTGAVIYSWRTGCLPCERLKRDIALRKDWKIGTTDDCHFKIAIVGPESAVPVIVYFVDGKEVGRIVGYDGSVAQLNAILAKHPKCSPDLNGARDDSQFGLTGRLSDVDPMWPGDGAAFFPTIVVEEVPFAVSRPAGPPVVPYRSSVSWGICGIPVLTHTHQGICNPATGVCY